METITRDVSIWIDIFKRINKLKDMYGYSIIEETLTFLENIKIYKESSLNDRSLLAVFWGYEITDIKGLISILKVIKDAYRYDYVIEELEECKEKYGVLSVAFIVDDLDKIKRLEIDDNEFVYFARDVIPFKEEKELVFWDSRPFIVDGSERVMYTSDFNLKCDTLPLKEEMDANMSKVR